MEVKLTASVNSRAPVVGALLLVLAAFVLAPLSMPSPTAMAQSGNAVMATYIGYRAPHVDWDLRRVNASCAALDGDKPWDWRLSYWWAAFYGPAAPRGNHACGLCLNVTNMAESTWTTTVRIVDGCGKLSGGVALGIDTVGFSEIDYDGRARMGDGRVEVSYQFVDCQD